MSAKFKFNTPFQVKDGVIYDRDGKKVKLWGVNYYAPFNHNYYNIEELGKDHFAAVDEDIRHFKMMGVDFIRMHLYEREITDRIGNIVENHNMKVFDYLVDQCEKNGIYLMVTPMVWWNTINNQIMQERYYAYWFIDAQESFGFSNFFSCDSMQWDPEAIKCQRIYFEGLFSRASTISGRKLSEYENVVAIELFNETRYIEKWQLADKDRPINCMSEATWSRGEQRLKLVKMWREFSEAHSEETDEDKRFSMFRASVMKNYFDKIMPIVDKHFGENAIKAQFATYAGGVPPDLIETFDDAGIDAVTIATYLNVNGFDSENTDSANHLDHAEKWFEHAKVIEYGKFAKISYEFDATATQNGYPLAAIAAAYAKLDVQLAAYFTYTPAAVAAWNPGWLVHFMSLEHTPSRAACFAAAGEILRYHNPEDSLEIEENVWRGVDYAIERENDFVYFKNDTIFRYSNDNDVPLGDISKLELVSGRGRSRFASSDGNGFYLLEKIGDDQWALDISPNQRYVSSPERGKAYRSMANRYVNCLKEAPVSVLEETKINFSLVVWPIIEAKEVGTVEKIVVDCEGAIRIKTGRYMLKVKSD